MPKLLTFEQLKSEKGITYCRTHITRLEDAGRFPIRRQLGAGRICWIEHEIDQHIANLAAGKLPPQGAPSSICKQCHRRFERKPGPGRPHDLCPECRGRRP